MKVLVLGASGATGKLVVQNLIERKISVRILIRETAAIPENFVNNLFIEIIKGNISEFNVEQIHILVNNCDAYVCCLGHNINFKGIFGPPYNLVSETVKKITHAIKVKGKTKFILMSTTAYTNKNIDENNTMGEKIVFSLLKIFLPPHRDNMNACDYLIYQLGVANLTEWIAVRPDSLIDEISTSDYEIFDSKVSSPIFNPGKTSRNNVSQFISELLTNDKLWQEWKFKTPVIYNKV